MSSSSPKINTAAAPIATAAKPGTSPTSPLSKEHLEGDALISALKQQLEFYFSKQNLATDAYLLSHMNASKFVPIDVIANFRKVKMLTEDRALLVDVMKQCRNLVVDETGTNVRPNIKMERTTLILRDIPASTPIDDIKSIFASTSAPAKPINVRSDIDDTWFVTFESEDACTDTALWLPSQTFQGKSVKCRVKSENLLRGFYYPNAPKETPPITAPIPMQASPTTQWRTTGSAPYYGNGYMPYAGYPYGYPAGYVQPTGQTPPQTNTRLDGKNERRQKNTNNGAPAQPNARKRGKGADAAAAAGSVQVVAAASGAVTVTGVVSPTAATPAAAPAPGQGKKALKRAKKAAAAQAAAAAAAAATPAATTATKATPDGVPLGLDNFPALPNNPVKKASPVSGYTSTFHEYDREAMAAIVAALCKQSYPRPDTFPTDPDSAIVRKTVLTTCQLMEPFPVIYPASPSPELAAQPTHSGLAMPFLDLGVGPASAVVAGRNPYIDAHPKKKATPSTTAQLKKKAAAATNATTAVTTTTPAASTSTTPASAPAANGKPKSATKASKPKYQKANSSASSSSTSTSTAASTSTSTSTSTSSTPTPVPTTPATPAVPVVTAASIVAANANLPVQPNPKQVAAAKKAAEEKAAREREAREKAAAAEASKSQSKGGKPKYQPKGTKQAAQKDKDKEKGDKNKENQATQTSENKNNETKSNEPPKIKWAAKVGSVDPAVALAKIAKAKAEAEQKAKAEATSSSSSSSSSSTSTSTSSTSSTSTSSTSTSSHSKDHSSKDKESSHSSKDAASAASPTASDDEANKKLSYAEMARRAKNAAAAAAAAAAAKSNGSDATPTSPTSSRINHSSSPTSLSPSPSPSSQ